MSTDGKDTACSSDKVLNVGLEDERQDRCDDEICEKKRRKPNRKVSFPDDDQIVTRYFEPANPWQDVSPTSCAQLAAEYLESCRRHNTPPIEAVLRQIRELCEGGGGAGRAPRLTLSECALLGAAPADALEAVLRRVQFRRLEIEHAAIDDEGAEALFDMMEYYESATVLAINGPRAFGIRGWQAASRMIKKSCQLSELELSNHPLEAGHAPVLARALHTHTCRLRVLCLQRAALAGDPLLCLVIALKSNNSIRELRLGDNRLGVADAAQLGSLLRYNTRLQLLDLSNNQIQDAGCGHIADALAEQAAQSPPSAATSPASPHHCPLSGYESRGLSFLVLWNNQLTRNCAHHLSKALTSSSLCVLNVGRNALGGEGVRALSGRGGGAGAGLHSLGLQSARLGPDAAPALAALVAHTQLQRLDLRDNKLGAACLQAIVSALKENSTLTQIDLDDPPESTTTLTPEDNSAASVARLTREIRALCRDRELPAAAHPRALHRKISLTCHTACIPRAMVGAAPAEEERRAGSGAGAGGGARLRSPLPSPAGSPVPQAHSRFSVTPVTPERELSTPTPPPHSPTPPSSRFRVVQVAETPQIHIHTAEPRRSSSRFSVTRNYDSVYNTAGHPPPATADAGTNTDKLVNKPKQASEVKPTPPAVSERAKTTASDKTIDISDKIPSDKTTDYKNNESDVNNKIAHVVEAKNDENNKSLPKTKPSHVNVTKIDHKGDAVDKKPIVSANNDVYKDKTEQVTHSEIVEDEVLKTKTELIKNITELNDSEKVDVEVKVVMKTESANPAKVHADQNEDFRNIDDININEKKNDDAMKQIEAITEDLGHLIREMKDLSNKTSVLKKGHDDKKKKCDIEVKIEDVPANFIWDNVVLKKNKSESSLDSPDLEVSRLMNKKMSNSPFCDSSSSLEISGSSMESLAEPIQVKPIIIQESVESDTELDRRKPERIILSTESSLESNTSEATPVNSGNFLNMSVSSNESVSPIIFGKTKKIHDSLSSLEASVSSLDSARQDKVMITSADSGIEYSLQNPSEGKEDNSSNEGTLTNNSSLKETVQKDSCALQDTLTCSPKRASSLLDVPALKSKGLDRMRKISWVAPSSSFQIPKPEPEKVEKIESKIPSNLEKLLSLFQHPTSLFSRSSNEDEKKSASSTPPRKDSSLTSSFWSWGSATEKDKDDKEDRDSSEATDSTLSERIQVSYVDESFSKKLDSKTPSTDTENTLSEFQSFPVQGNSENSDASQTEKLDRVTDITTDNLVQKSLVVSAICMENEGSNCDIEVRACDIIDLIKPNDLNKNWTGDANKSQEIDKDTEVKVEREEIKDTVRPRSFAAVLKSSGSENSLDKQTSPDGQSVDKLPSKVIRGIKENISPENTLTSSMTNTKTLALELAERQVKSQTIVNTVWEMPADLLDKDEMKAPIATIEETCDEAADNTVELDFIDDIKFIDEKNISADSGVTSLEGVEDKKFEKVRELESVDLGKDALSYLIYENQDFEPDTEHNVTDVVQEGSLAQELKEAEIKEKLDLDLSPELVIDETLDMPEVFVAKDMKVHRTSPIIPDRAKLKKSNSLEELSQSDDSPKTKTIAFKIPETTPRDIPERRAKLRSRGGSSPKSLPESLNKPCPLAKMECKKKKKVSSLGKMAKDSLLALNMSEEEIAEFRRSYKLTSVESLRSLESVSEDANSQSGTSVDSRCRACLRQSQESLMSLDSITEDCRCTDNCDKEKPGRAVR